MKNERDTLDAQRRAEAEAIDAEIRAIAARRERGRVPGRARLDQVRAHVAEVRRFTDEIDQHDTDLDTVTDLAVWESLTRDLLDATRVVLFRFGPDFEDDSWARLQPALDDVEDRRAWAQEYRDELEREALAEEARRAKSKKKRPVSGP